MQIALTIVDGSFSIYRLANDAVIPDDVLQEPFFAILHSEEELSLVCRSSLAVTADRNSAGWACLKVAGPLDFGLTGIIAAISAALSTASLSVFVISSFDTDYVLVRETELDSAFKALRAAGIECTGDGEDLDLHR